jgi:hypothetical protein
MPFDALFLNSKMPFDALFLNSKKPFDAALEQGPELF